MEVFTIQKPTLTAYALISLVLIVFVTGMVSADQPVNATLETQALTTTTSLIADGLAMDNAGLAWSLSNAQLNAPPLEAGEVQYTTAYDASTVAQAGSTTFVKTMAIDTRNKVLSQHNVKADTAVTYIATADGGDIIGTENILLDGAGDNTTASDRMLCPFAAATNDIIPAYCNIVQMGSKYDLVVGSVTTSASDPFVAKDATVPVDLNYQINVKPYGTTSGQIPAIGSAMAYVKVHVQEARDNAVVTITPSRPVWIVSKQYSKDEDLIYNEVSTAQGTITAFNKIMAYQSGKTLVV